MNTESLIVQPGDIKFPTANMRTVYHTKDVEDKLSKLEEHSNEGLRTTYRNMLERGGRRFNVKLSGVPDMASLYQELPNFTEVLDDIKRNVALCHDSSDGLEITPILLLGPPGIGKTHFSQQIGELLGAGMSLIPMSSTTAG